MKYLAKVDHKLAYNQIKINSKFQEVTIMNTPTELQRWIRLSLS